MKKTFEPKPYLKQALQFLIHNWPWKLLSLLLAVCLWSGLITADSSLTREKTFNDVSINIIGSDTLRRNGYIVVDGLDNLPLIRLKAEVPQNVYNTVSASNFNVRIDLSRIRGTGTQTLNILSTNSSTYGTVTEVSIGTVTLQVDEYVTRSRIPVRLETSGQLPEGMYATSAAVDPLYVTVSGPLSRVRNIIRCVADYDLSLLSGSSGNERTAVPFRLISSDQSTVDSALIEVTSESVLLDSLIVEQTIYPTKSLVINTADLTCGQPAEGYALKRITVEPSSVLFAANEKLLNSLDELHLIEYIESQIDISGATASFQKNVTLSKPTGVIYCSADSLTVTIEIVSNE